MFSGLAVLLVVVLGLVAFVACSGGDDQDSQGTPPVSGNQSNPAATPTTARSP